MARRIATGIDIGTHHIKVVIVEELITERGRETRILGTGLAESRGLRHGYIVDADEARESVRRAKQQAEQAARLPIRSAFLAIGGVSLDEARASGETVISRADQEITDLDIDKVRENAREAADQFFINRDILHEVPLSFRVDGVKTFGDPVGMKGTRLEADYLFITTLKNHAESLAKAVEDVDVEVLDTMATPLAGSYVTLTKDQKMKGCVLANIGAETTSVVVYDEGLPMSVRVFPTGSTNITDDLALGFRVSLEDAERIKLGRLSGTMYPRKKVDEIIALRFRTVFELVDKHLKQIGKRGSLPAGIIISGGGAGQGNSTDIARTILALPSRLADLQVSPDTKIKDNTWAVAYGLSLWGLTGDTTTPQKNPFEKLAHSTTRFLKQFLP